MISALVEEAVASGARLESACKELGIDARTIQRWAVNPDAEDARRGSKTKPENALNPADEADILTLLTSAEFVDLTPHQVVANLADMSIYKASERTMYRLLKRRSFWHTGERADLERSGGPPNIVPLGPGKSGRGT